MEGRIVVVDGAVRILQAVPRQDADDGRPSRHLVSAFDQACHRGCAGWFAEDAFLTSQQFVSVNDFRICHIQECSIAGGTGGDGFLSVDRIADANGRRDGFRIAHGGFIHQGC